MLWPVALVRPSRFVPPTPRLLTSAAMQASAPHLPTLPTPPHTCAARVRHPFLPPVEVAPVFTDMTAGHLAAV